VSDGLKVGDLMILTQGAYSSQHRVPVPISRLTATRVMVQYGQTERAFTRSRLEEVGSTGYHRPSLQTATPEMVERVREENHRRRLLARIAALEWKKLSTTHLENVLAAAENL
jgi:hypothetical protein